MSAQTDNLLSNNLWILSLLPPKIPGQVVRKLGNPLIIQPLIEALPLDDGGIAKQFFAPGGNANEYDYVLFKWEETGKRGFDYSKNALGNPTAVHIEVVDKHTAVEIAEEFKQRIGSRLQKEFEDKLKDLSKKESYIENLVEEKVQDRLTQIEDWVHKLEQRETNLKAETDRLAAELEEREQQLRKKAHEQEKLLDQRKDELHSLVDSVKQQQSEAESLIRSVEPYRLAVPQQTKAATAAFTEIKILPEKLASQWQNALASKGLILPESLAVSYLISLLSAFYSGSLVLLNGPVGVGKTSVVNASAKLLGGHSKVIPVRPAWLDPTDLLGFFDPIKEVFRPTPFLTALKEARDFPNNLCLICLDELNLARIENYGSDLLSALEYSRSNYTAKEGLKEKQGLLLYSEDIETDLWQEALFLNEKPEKSDKEQLRLQQLQSLLNDFQSIFYLSSNTAILGTLNSDETTYDLSPKVIDRAYVVSYSAADLTLPFTSELFSKNSEVLEPLNLSVSTLVDKIDQLLNLFSKPENTNQPEMKDVTEGLNLGWKRVLQWNKLFSELGIPLGHRASRDFKVMYAVCHLLGLSPQDCLGHFLFIKLLPRISFFKDSNKQDQFDQLLNAFNKDLKALGTNLESYDPGDVLTQLQAQVDDSRRQYVRYWVRT